MRKSLESLKLLDNVPLTEKKKTLSSKSLLQDEWRLISEGIKYRGDLVDQPGTRERKGVKVLDYMSMGTRECPPFIC